MKSKYEKPLGTGWLYSREKYDIKARNQAVLNDFLSSTEKFDTLRIADIGCGTGNNPLYLTEKIDKNIEWHLVERETHLLDEAKFRIKQRYKAYQSRHTEDSENCFQFDVEDRTITYHFHNELGETFMDRNYALDFITASALFDLFTEKEFSTLLQQLLDKGISLYSVLTFEGMIFTPPSESDEYYIQLYETHMSRPLDKGRPMGKTTMDCIQRLVQADSRASMISGASTWNISPADANFVSQNLDFYADSIPELLEDENSIKKFNIWLEDKQLSFQNFNLGLNVFHQDFFIESGNL